MQHTCQYPGCSLHAEMLPRLIVFSHPMSIKQYRSHSAVMSWPVCRKHFAKLTASEFLSFGDIRASLEHEFRMAGALPDFNRARLVPVRKADPAFKNWEQRMSASDESRRMIN